MSNKNDMMATTDNDKFYEIIISTALMFKTRKAYGSFEKALRALMKRKLIVENGCNKTECEKQFRIALKVVDDALEFENNYIHPQKVKTESSVWFDESTTSKINRKMEEYLKEKNPDAHPLFLARSVARVYYFYHLT